MKEIKLTLIGNPISTQHIYKMSCQGRIPRLYMSKIGKDRKIDYQWQISQQYKEKIIEDDIEIEIILFFGDKRKHDWDNYNKLTDCLIGQVIKDDSQIKKATIEIKFDKENPRIELKICK